MSKNDWVTPTINFFQGLGAEWQKAGSGTISAEQNARYKKQYGKNHPRYKGSSGSSGKGSSSPTGMSNLGSNYKAEELEAGRKAEAHRPGAGFPQSGGGNQDHGRGQTRTNANGVEQTGTNTGFKGADVGMANALLDSLGITTVKYGQFESNDLPSKDNPSEKTSKTDDTVILGGATPNQYTRMQEPESDKKFTPIEETNIVNTGYQLGSRERYRSEFMADQPGLRGDVSTSLAGLRAADASKGLLYASGQYWMENGDGGFDKIDKATYRAIKSGNQHARQYGAEQTNLKESVGNQPTYEQAVESADQYDYGSDAGYPDASGNQWTGAGRPDQADYPEASVLEPEDTTTDKVSRVFGEHYKKAQDAFKTFANQEGL